MYPETPAVGALVDGRYQLQSTLGAGMFGEVWTALDVKFTRRTVAIKLLKPELSDDLDAVARFEGEATALGMLRHPNVVGVLDRGAWAGRRFIAMEYVEGVSLARWLADHRARRAWPELAAVARLFDQVCAGVAAAHRVRAPGPIVHRDLKPANLLLGVTPEGDTTVKVLDFGIAQLGARQRTASGMVLGSVPYMAPEQAQGRISRVGPWTDVFALGVILTEMLSLRMGPPPGGRWWWALALESQDEVRATLAGLRPGLAPAVWDVVASALRADGAARPPDAAALREALHAAWSAAPSTAPPGDHPPAPLVPSFAPPDDTSPEAAPTGLSVAAARAAQGIAPTQVSQVVPGLGPMPPAPAAPARAAPRRLGWSIALALVALLVGLGGGLWLAVALRR